MSEPLAIQRSLSAAQSETNQAICIIQAPDTITLSSCGTAPSHCPVLCWPCHCSTLLQWLFSAWQHFTVCLYTQAMTHGLADVVLGAQPETLQAVLGALVRGGSQHVDPAVRKTCAQVSAAWDRSAVLAAAPLSAVPSHNVKMDTLCAYC